MLLERKRRKRNEWYRKIQMLILLATAAPKARRKHVLVGAGLAPYLHGGELLTC
jgi:hypothetical protein